jgi:tetratricopeptide (TPR) repeat protein
MTDNNSLYEEAISLQKHGDIKQAIKIFSQLLENNGNDYKLLDRLVVAHSHLGNHEQAEKFCRKMLELEPENPEPYKYLSGLKKFILKDKIEIEKLEQKVVEIAADSQIYIDLCFSLGKMFADIADFDKAFKYYELANSTYRKMHPYTERENMENFLNSQINLFTKDFFEERKEWGNKSKIPVFIVGMPRSGTSLIEQILASHPSIHGAGELIFIPSIPAKTPPANLDVKMTAELAEKYLSILTKDVIDPPDIAIDKMPHNFWHLGLIALLFPNAKIIHCTRNPISTSLSLYFARFARGNYFSYDFDSIGFFFGLYKKIMQHWKATLPLKMIEVSYEGIINDTESEVKNLLEFLELPWDDACLTHHKTKRTIATASHWQAKQPIYKSSLNSWKNYEKHIGELKKALED